MKLKRQPEDFRVEELPLVEGGDAGRFAFYRLTKRGVGTLEALEEIRRRWNLSSPADQLRRPEGPARGHDPIPDDPRRPRPGTSASGGSTSSRSAG